MKKIFIILLNIFVCSSFLMASPFNQKLTDEEKIKLEKGEVLIRNIAYPKNICLNDNVSTLADQLLSRINELKPKYLAEVIQFKTYEGNEDLPQRLEELLNNIPSYAGIPYFSERKQKWYDLYSSATIVEKIEKENFSIIKADIEMEPFGIMNQEIELYNDEESILYSAKNTNKLRYHDKFDCVWPEKMSINILLFRDGDKWILYGIGGVNAPRIPFFIERIEVSFINRITTFCNFIFNKF